VNSKSGAICTIINEEVIPLSASNHPKAARWYAWPAIMDITTTVNQVITALRSPNFAGTKAVLARCESLLASTNQADEQFRPLAPALAELAASAARQGWQALAARALKLSLCIDPSQLQAWLNLGGLLIVGQRYLDALEVLTRASEQFPNNAEISFRIGVALQESGRADEALPYYCTTLDLDDGHIDARVNLGTVLAAQGDYEAGAKVLREALALQPDNPSVVLAHADICLHTGKMAETLQSLRGVVKNQSLPGHLRARACFALGKTLDRNGEYDQAFDWYAQGNDIMFQGFDLKLFARQVDLLRDTFDHEHLDRLPSSGLQDETPVFILGMPRSGTTLIEQILTSHTQVHSAGEREEINDIVRGLNAHHSTHGVYPHCLNKMTGQDLVPIAQKHLAWLHKLDDGATRILDKMPRNFMHVGLIRLLFPKARIIICMRDARDTCLSCYFQIFAGAHPYSYDLATLGHFYRHYEQLMQHWQTVMGEGLLQMHYEDLVSDQEANSRRLVEFCGLDWEADCLRFHETRRTVNTSSRDQVRSPIYSSSTGRWRHYERHLVPLLEALAATD